MTGSMLDWATLFAVFVGVGAFAGLALGALTIGGGLALTIAAIYGLGGACGALGASVHMAVFTALATIALLSARSLRGHQQRGAVDWALLRLWAPAAAIGAAMGAIGAHLASPPVLMTLIGVAGAVASIQMALHGFGAKRIGAASAPPMGLLGGAWAGGLGAVSAVLGGGGGVVAGPTLMALGAPAERAAGAAAVLGIAIGGSGALFGAGLGMIAPAPDQCAAPFSFGHVNLFGVLSLGVAVALTAPIGAKMARPAPRRSISFIFGLVLTMACVNLVREALTA